ncbi:putative epoxide hydrolase [Lachnellula suecica]|uniref:Putative epoxide hydrolase n=1 Tax=Lachnellula suecica TaxID=602035 RepID=A0A8T9CJM5_9HELO|nr:putative epoxide hydrolase [Lachnellula suecica]
MALPFFNPPSGCTVTPTPFSINIPESSLTELQTILKYSKLAKPTYENSNSDKYHGVSREWLEHAKSSWENTFDWRKSEAYVNNFPQYTMPVVVNGQQPMKIHFAALFSERKDAVPLLLLHGWPGSFLEFLPMLSLLQQEHTPSNMPYHVIVPSLPGFAFSDAPPLDREFDLGDVAALMDGLMGNLGFGGGYVAQGGDVGSKVSRILGAKCASCKAVHLNYCPVPEPANPIGEVDKIDLEIYERAAEFKAKSGGYAVEQATRPSTIGLVLANPEIDTILEAISLYWLTDTIPSSVYMYRQRFESEDKGGAGNPNYYIDKPLGFSAFPQERWPAPKAWAATTGDLGGHFAALEQPALLLQDIKDFVAQVWKSVITYWEKSEFGDDCRG